VTVAEKISVSLVSYTNSKPFLFGLENSSIINKINLSLDTPADCAKKLMSGEAAIGLVPVASISQIDNAKMITDYGIASTGKVDSVLLLSQVPLYEIENVLLDYQSKTSVKLVQVLTKEYWKKNFNWLPAKIGFEENISQTTAGVVIGDRALDMKSKFEFAYDLSAEWFQFTNLPFIFARWITNTKLEEDFMAEFSSALEFGINNIDNLLTQLMKNEKYSFDVANYLKHSIQFKIDTEMEKGMRKFLSFI
jgi:chorismate dehydratase